MKIETLAVHSGNRVDPATGAVTLPIHLTTTFERREDGGYPQGYIYARNSNPNRAMLEECLAALGGGGGGGLRFGLRGQHGGVPILVTW